MVLGTAAVFVGLCFRGGWGGLRVEDFNSRVRL